MKYVLLLVGPPGSGDDLSPEELKADMERHYAFGRMLNERGAQLGGEVLREQSAAKTIRPGPGGEMLVTDGPFAELKEQIGGFYVIEAKDMDDALEIARQCPNYGGIEVRPAWEMPAGS